MHVCIHVCIYVIFKLGFERYGGNCPSWEGELSGGNCPGEVSGGEIFQGGNVRAPVVVVLWWRRWLPTACVSV